ncbi:hypothetical protein BRC85_02930 [Halobacteriales archaeon QS_1_69_70]|nr:MAG: hypothetical protein BRC85_02930 [Halobacteriales archaeon QS_1_69_70]
MTRQGAVHDGGVAIEIAVVTLDPRRGGRGIDTRVEAPIRATGLLHLWTGLSQPFVPDGWLSPS